MKTVFFAVLLFFITTNLFAQWYYQYGGTSSDLYESFLFDQFNGWIVGADGVILNTTDAGTTWIPKESGTYNALSFIKFFDNSNGIVAGAFGIIKKTSNSGETWYPISSGTTSTIHEGFFINENIGWLVGNNGLLLRTTNGGDSWQNSFIAPGSFHWVQFINQDTGWVCSYDMGQVWKTIDGGNTWSLKINLGYEIWQIHFINELVGWVIGDYGLILKTIDGGNNWSFQNSPVNTKLRSVYFNDPNYGWIVGKNQTILHTSDGGNLWSVVQYGWGPEYYHLNFIDSNNGWIIGFQGIILHTDNGGIGGVTPVELISFTAEYDAGSTNLAWITATELNNAGFDIERKTEVDEWNKISFIQGNGTTTEAKHYFFSDDIKDIIASKLIYRLKQIDFDGTFRYSNEIEVDMNFPKRFHLEQNYPNPFNPMTNISFTLPYKQKIKLSVHNNLGEEIAVLANSIYDEGKHEIVFDGSNFSSGIYYCNIIADDLKQSIKMILLK